MNCQIDKSTKKKKKKEEEKKYNIFTLWIELLHPNKRAIFYIMSISIYVIKRFCLQELSV